MEGKGKERKGKGPSTFPRCISFVSLVGFWILNFRCLLLSRLLEGEGGEEREGGGEILRGKGRGERSGKERRAEGRGHNGGGRERGMDARARHRETKTFAFSFGD